MTRILPDSELLDLSAPVLAHLSDRRATVIGALRPLVGLEPADAAYQAALYPNDPPSQRRALALAQSSCGITTEVGWRAAGVDDARLSLPYGERAVRGGVLYPLALEVVIARECGAWRVPDVKTGALPIEGDAVIVGNPGAAAGVWSKGGGFGGSHIFTVVMTEYAATGAAHTIHSIDGGQPGIHCRTRGLVWCGPNGSELWCASLDAEGGYVFDATDLRPTKGRRVQGWIDIDGLRCAA